MLRLLLLSALVALAVARTPRVRPMVPMGIERIVGGTETIIQDLPYQVSVRSYRTHICGGSIISPNKVLTAGHCTAQFTSTPLSVRAGSTFRGKGGGVVQVESVCQHPQFDLATADNDVSVLTLAKPLYFTQAIQPIALPEIGTFLPVGTLAVVSGWGDTSQGRSLSSVLQKVAVLKVSQQFCKAAYGQESITDTMTCYGFAEGGKDACHSDSGGPLAIGRVQIGVVSWGHGCARPGEPGVYADLTNANILNHINSC